MSGKATVSGVESGHASIRKKLLDFHWLDLSQAFTCGMMLVLCDMSVISVYRYLQHDMLTAYQLYTRTHAHTQPFHGSMDFVRDNLGEPVPEETFTHSHLSWSSIYYNPWHPLCSVHTPDNLSPSFLWSTSWPGTFHFILHTFLHPTQSLSSFHNTCPYHRNLFRCSTEIMSSNPSLSLNPLLGILSRHTSI